MTTGLSSVLKKLDSVHSLPILGITDRAEVVGNEWAWKLALKLTKRLRPVMVMHTFNPSTWEAEASLVYRVSSRTARATKRNLVSKE